MAVDKNKIVAEATKLVQKGAYDKAIKTYEKILAEDPKDVRVLLKVGELQQKKGDDKAAAVAFQKVAETYAEQGFFLKSVAVYKQIVKLDPEDVRVNERLAGLYQQLGLMSDAMSQLQFMAAAYEKHGDGAKLTDVLKRMVELDPENIASSIKLGELHARANQAGPALDCFRRAAEYLKRHSRADEYLKVAERIAVLQPDDLALTRELANIYLAKGDTKRALAKLQLCFKADPKDVETLQLLAQAFRDLGQTTKTVSVYKELARVHDERGRPVDARGVWKKVQELAPDDDEARAALGGAATPAAAAPAFAPPPPPPRATPAPVAAAAPFRAPPPGPPPGIARPPPPAAGASDAIPKLLTETDVYVKYGLHDKALDHLRKVLALDPQCADAHEKARELHLAVGRGEDAARSGVLAVRALLAKGLTDRAREAVSRLKQLAPDHPDVAELNVAVGGTEEVSLEPVDFEEVFLAPDDVDAEPADDDALALALAAETEGDEIVDDEPAPAPRAAPVPRRETARDLDAAGDALAEAAALASAESEEVVEEPSCRAPEPPRADDEEADLSDELEEADFFLQQGLVDEAREALQNLRAFYPGHSGVEARLAGLDRRESAAASPASSTTAAPAGDDSFDIARELAEELGGHDATSVADEEFQYSVEDVFNQFKKGVEQTVRPEDSATHYDLGIAYKEMGLVDDAIHEFETALRGNDRKKEVDCLSMIGLCELARGDGKGAVAAFRRALGSAQLTKEAAKAVQFDLAAAYEASGDVPAALWFLNRVAKLDPSFREVSRRIEELGGGPGRAPADEARARPVGSGAAPARPPAAPRPAAPPVAGPKKNIGYL